jgi:hypothetical protein
MTHDAAPIGSGGAVVALDLHLDSRTSASASASLDGVNGRARKTSFPDKNF